MTSSPSVRVVGPGRAGGALSIALAEAGWTVREPVHHGDDVATAANDVDLLVLATPDSVIEQVAFAVTPVETAVVAHLSGAQGLAVLESHPHRAALHPLTSMPSAEVGAQRLRRGAWFAIDANSERSQATVNAVVHALGGRSFVVEDDQRASYHAAAAIASNHVVALLGSVERIADVVGVPIEAYLELVRASIDNIEELGLSNALTGPVARGDWATVERHRNSIDPSELALYDALVEATQRVVNSQFASEESSKLDDRTEP